MTARGDRSVVAGTAVGSVAGPGAGPAPAGERTRAPAAGARDVWLVGALAAVVSAALAWVPSLWLDEVVTHNVVDRPWDGTVGVLGHIDAVHGLYYLLLHAWTGVAGTSPLALRLPSALAVGLAAAATVRIGDEVAGRRVGVVAGLLLAVLPAATSVGGEARSAAFVMAATTWATWAGLRAVRGAGPWWRYAVLVALGGLLSVTSLVVLVGHAVTWWWSRVPAATVRDWGRAAAIAVLPVLPVAVVAVGQRGQVGWITRPDVPELVRGVVVGQWFPDAGELALVAGAAAVAVVAAPRWFPTAWSGRPVALVPLALPWAAVPTVLLVLVSLVAVPLWVPRYLHHTAPAVALVLAAAVAALHRRVLQGVAVVAVAALAAGAYADQRGPSGHHGSDWAAAASVVQSRAHAGDAVLFAPDRPVDSPRRALEAYPAAFAGVDDVGLDAPLGAEHPLFTVGAGPRAAVARLARASRVWVLAADEDGARATLDALAAQGWRGATVWAGPTTRVLLLRPGP